MQINIQWGNLDTVPYATEKLDSILKKNLDKISRLLSKLDKSSSRIKFYFKYDENKKRYKTVIHFVTPKANHHITERGFTLEESINRSVSNLRRKFRKSKEKQISLSRKKVLI